jgi:hypothetical protein
VLTLNHALHVSFQASIHSKSEADEAFQWSIGNQRQEYEQRNRRADVEELPVERAIPS